MWAQTASMEMDVILLSVIDEKYLKFTMWSNIHIIQHHLKIEAYEVRIPHPHSSYKSIKRICGGAGWAVGGLVICCGGSPTAQGQ